MYLPNYNVVKTKKKRVITKKNLSEFETFEADQPHLPEFTCPHIDEVIDHSHKTIYKLEEIRNMNTQLRDNAEFLKNACEEMQHNLTKLTEWKSYITDCVSR